MNYSEIIDRVFRNTEQDRENSKDISGVKQDIADVIKDVFTRAEAPRKSVQFNLSKYKTTTETFSDTSTEWTSSFSNFSISGGQLTADGGLIATATFSELNDIRSVSFKTAGVLSVANGSPEGTIKVLSEDGDTLWSDTFTIGETEATIEKSPGVIGVNIKLVIEVNIPGNWTSIYIDDLSIEKNLYYVDMPTDFFVPLEVVFRESLKGTIILSSEVLYERFMNWNPNKLYPDASESTGDVTKDVETDYMTYFYTEENVLYDGRIGYAFQFLQNSVRLWYKPAINGIVDIYYAHIPVLSNISEGNPLDIIEAFSDMLVAGATHRQLVRKLKNPGKWNLEGLAVEVRHYNVEYRRLTKVFAGYFDKEAEPSIIMPFSICDDIGQRLI